MPDAESVDADFDPTTALVATDDMDAGASEDAASDGQPRAKKARKRSAPILAKYFEAPIDPSTWDLHRIVRRSQVRSYLVWMPSSHGLASDYHSMDTHEAVC